MSSGTLLSFIHEDISELLPFPFSIFENKSFASWTKLAPLFEASAAPPVAMVTPAMLAGTPATAPTPVVSSPTPTPASVPPPTIPPTFPTFIS